MMSGTKGRSLHKQRTFCSVITHRNSWSIRNASEGTCVENMMTEQDFSKEESTIILIILYYLIRCKSAVQPSPIELKELRNSCLTFHKGSNGGKKLRKSIYQVLFFVPGDIFVSREIYSTTHSQKFPAGSPHGLAFETLIRDTLGQRCFLCFTALKPLVTNS